MSWRGARRLALLEAPVRPIADRPRLRRPRRLRQAAGDLPRPLRQRGQLPRLPAHPRPGHGDPLPQPRRRQRGRRAVTAADPDAGDRRRARLARHALPRPGERPRRRLRLPRPRRAGSGASCYGPEPMPIPPYSRDWGETGSREPLAEAARAVMIELPADRARARRADPLPDARRRGRQTLRHRHRARPLHPRLRAQRRRRGAARRRLAPAHRLRLPVPRPELTAMASIILAAAGTAIGGSVGGSILGVSAAAIGGAVGSIAGAAVDSWLVASMAPTQRIAGQRLDTLQITASTEGAVIPRVYGRDAHSAATSSGRPTSARRPAPPSRAAARAAAVAAPRSPSTSTSRRFAVALCEGPITGIGRIWADGKLMSRDGITLRLHKGGEDQEPDPFIAAKMGARTPRPIAAPPTSSSRSWRSSASATGCRSSPSRCSGRSSTASSAESLVRAVTLIPASGEFAYATEIVRREGGDGETSAENVNAEPDAADLAVALDRLEACAPKVESVSLVVAWFGDDLRAGHCRIRPGVEVSAKSTTPENWSVDGVARAAAHLVSRDDQGRPAYGGTPSDSAVVQAIRELKARGYRVTFYPFILMDVPPGNDLPDPYSDHAAATGQPAYPWRGRITCSPAAGYAGSPDKSAAAGAQVAAFFGDAQPVRLRRRRRAGGLGRRPGRLGPAADDPALRAPLRRGGRGRCLPDRLGAARDHASAERRVELSGGRRARRPRGRRPRDPRAGHEAQLRRRLVGVLRAPPAGRLGRRLLPPRPALGRRDDRLRRHRQLHAARRLARRARASRRRERSTRSPTSTTCAANIEGGEGYDWYYASAADREAQVRTPITDGAAGKPWVFRNKDIRRWWSNPHRNRPGGIESGSTDGVGAGEQADPLHRDRLPGGRSRPEPAERLLRPEVGRELPAVLLPRLARRRRAAALPRGGARLLGRAGEQPDVERLLRPDDHHRRDRRLDLGRAALSGVPGAQRRLDRRRQLAARPLAERPARLGLARQPGPRALPPRRAARRARSTPRRSPMSCTAI